MAETKLNVDFNGVSTSSTFTDIYTAPVGVSSEVDILFLRLNCLPNDDMELEIGNITLLVDTGATNSSTNFQRFGKLDSQSLTTGKVILAEVPTDIVGITYLRGGISRTVVPVDGNIILPSKVYLSSGDKIRFRSATNSSRVELVAQFTINERS